MPDHIPSEVLLTYIDDPTSIDDPAALSAHLRGCIDCQGDLDELRRLDDRLHGAVLWREPHPDDAPRPDDSFFEKMKALSTRLDGERRKADEVVPLLTDGDPATWRSRATFYKGAITITLLRQILNEADRLLDSAPTRSLELALFAAELAGSINPGADRHERDRLQSFTAHAHLEQGKANRFLGNLRDAHVALDRAAALFALTFNPNYDLAFVDYARASVLWIEHRFDEALTLIRACAQTFSAFGDIKQRQKCLTLEAGILYQRGDVMEARNLSLHLMEGAREENDLALQARLCGNLAICNRDLGDFDSAGSYFFLAITLFDDLGMKTESIRMRWSLADLLARSGKFADALDMVTRAEREFDELGMTGEAGMVALLRAEVLLALDRTAEAEAVCQQLPERYTRIGAPAQALQAVAFLRDIGRAHAATPTAVRYVRSFLERLPAEPSLLFAPPPA